MKPTEDPNAAHPAGKSGDGWEPPRPEGRLVARVPSMVRRFGPKLVLSLLVGGLFGWLAHAGGVPIIPSGREAFANVIWWTIPAYCGTQLFTHFFRASRWRFLIAPIKKLPLREVVALNWIGFFAIFAFPLRLGEFARPALTKMRHGIPVSAGIGTVAVERVIDGLITSLCVAWAFLVLPRNETNDPLAEHLPSYGYAALTVFTCAFLALGVFLWKRALAQRLTERILGIFSKRLATVLARKVGDVADGVRSLGDLRLSAGFLSETLIYWGANAGGMWLLAWGCGISLTFGHAVAIMGVLAIGILLPTGPGLFGNFQLAVSLALKLYVATDIVATGGGVYIFLLYVCQAVLIILAGLIPLFAMRIPFSALLKVSQPANGDTTPPPAS